MAGKHRPGIHEGYLMSRCLKIEGAEEVERQHIIHAIDQLKGVDLVSFVKENSKLKVVYDGSMLSVDDIEQVVRENGCRFADDWWNRYKLGWYRYTDENVRSSAKHVPHCCNKPP